MTGILDNSTPLSKNPKGCIKPASPSQKSKIENFLDYIWPIARSELPKFLFISLLMFCILGIQNLVRAMKDSVINTMIGTETISFLKLWGVLPAAFLITIIYVKLVNAMKGENIFYFIMSIFIGFFLLFAFYLFPNHKTLHLSVDTVQNLVTNYPHFKWFILLMSNWSFSLFYIIAELWPSAIFALLFWQFVNKITTIEESKRFYPLFGLLGQTGLYLSGQFLENLPVLNKYIVKILHLTASRDVISMQLVITIILILSLIAVFSFWLLNHKILDFGTIENLQFKVKKSQLGLRESLKMVAKSRYIRLITILLICYGFAINLVEGPWKSEATKLYPDTTDFAAFIGRYLSYTGILTVLFVLIGSNLVRKLGWATAAMITPFMVLITGLMFFLITNFDPVAMLMITFFAFTDPMMLAIIVGAIQNVLSKSTKYTLFDSTKEMSYVPLDDQLKTKGKAAADMIGVKLGKSSGAFVQSFIFMILPHATYSSISPFLMVIFTLICIVWIWAVIELNKEYKAICK